MAKGLPPDIRRAGLAAVAGIIYLAVSPDQADGLSDLELQELKQHGPAWIQLTELLGRVLPEGVRLPNGFAEHFTRDVLPAIDVVRGNSGARNQVRSEIRDCIGSRSCIDSLYTESGRTFSGMLERAAAGTVREGTHPPGVPDVISEAAKQFGISSGKPGTVATVAPIVTIHVGGRLLTGDEFFQLPQWAQDNPERVMDWRFGQPLAHED